MSAHLTLRRREFLQSLGTVTVAGLAFPGVLPLGCGAADPLSAALSGFFAKQDGARRIGHAYLRTESGIADRVALLEAIAGERLEIWRALAADDPAGLAAELKTQHREDFEANRVVLLGGWVLSRTEALLCALAALS